MISKEYELHQSPPDEDYALNNAYYFFVLSNGEVVWQDDDNPHKSEPSTWKRLQKYLTDTKVRIVVLALKFRSHEIHIRMNEDDDLLYFCRAIGKDWDASFEDHYFVVGRRTTPTRITNIWYKLPSLEVYKTVSKEICDIDLSERKLYFFC